jgi:hypothetical protein
MNIDPKSSPKASPDFSSPEDLQAYLALERSRVKDLEEKVSRLSQSEAWVKGTWDGLQPVIPENMPQNVWLVVHFPWASEATPRPKSKDSLYGFLRNLTSHELPFGAKPNPPRWFWMPLAIPQTKPPESA